MKLNNFDSEEMQAAIKAYFEDVENRDKKALEIVKNRGEDILERIFKIIGRDGALVDESLLYRSEEFDVTEEEYYALFNAMVDYAGDERVFHDEENFFEHKIFCYEHEGELIELFIMWGQGCATSFSEVSRINFDSFNALKVVKFSDFMSSIRKQIR